ncbi:MAG: hypothetical protein QM640_06340 [Niabella sp.]
MKTKTNYFRYKTDNGWKSGYFNIYQARNGSIHIIMGNVQTTLTLQQINELFLDVYSLPEFDHDLFVKFYHIKTKNNSHENNRFERTTN